MLEERQSGRKTTIDARCTVALCRSLMPCKKNARAAFRVSKTPQEKPPIGAAMLEERQSGRKTTIDARCTVALCRSLMPCKKNARAAFRVSKTPQEKPPIGAAMLEERQSGRKTTIDARCTVALCRSLMPCKKNARAAFRVSKTPQEKPPIGAAMLEERQSGRKTTIDARCTVALCRSLMPCKKNARAAFRVSKTPQEKPPIGAAMLEERQSGRKTTIDARCTVALCRSLMPCKKNARAAFCVSKTPQEKPPIGAAMLEEERQSGRKTTIDARCTVALCRSLMPCKKNARAAFRVSKTPQEKPPIGAAMLEERQSGRKTTIDARCTVALCRSLMPCKKNARAAFCVSKTPQEKPPIGAAMLEEERQSGRKTTIDARCTVALCRSLMPCKKNARAAFRVSKTPQERLPRSTVPVREKPSRGDAS